jgi:aspartyl-tRNA(Asn)/glutamyl-tRNA(Gln) amidotransferase subunit B
LAEIRDSMPELPPAKRKRFVDDYGVSEYDARVLIASKETSDYFETAAKLSGDPKMAANWVQGELTGALKTAEKTIAESLVSAEGLAELLKLLADGTLSSKLAKDVFAKMFATGKPAAEIIEAEGLRQISDTGELEKIIDEIIAANPAQVATYRGGKTGILAFFVGQIMKATRGQANPKAVNELLVKKLAG